MKKILLPELVRVDKVGKNVIEHKLFESTDFESASIEVGDTYLILKNEEGQTICIVQKNKHFPETLSKVLTMDKKPTVENCFDPSLSLKWLKYPNLIGHLNPDSVCNSWKNAFTYKEEDLSNNIFGLRKPQIAAVFNVLSHWRVDDDLGTVVMPTGTGKTETMLSLLIAHQCKRLLVIVPSDPLREQIADKFITLGHLQKSEFGIVASSPMKPIVGILYENFKTKEELIGFLEQCNVIVTTMDLISAGNNELQATLSQNVSHIFIDEAHHIKAPTWLHFRNICQKGKVIQLPLHRSEMMDKG